MASSDTDPFLQNNSVGPTSSTDPIQHYYGNAKIIMSALVILFFIIAFVLIFHIYSKWIAARGRHSSTIWSSFDLAPLHRPSSSSAPLSHGLDKTVVDSLPVFIYNPQKMNDKMKMKKGMPAMAMAECAVCLSEFEEGEECRFLPVCKHFFHTDCINMWFFSHTTCPLCRTSAEKIPKEEQEEEEEQGTEREVQNEEDGAMTTEGGEEEKSSITGLLLAQKRLSDKGTRERLGFRSEINGEEEEEEEEEEEDDDQRRLVEEASNSRRRWRRSFSDKKRLSDKGTRERLGFRSEINGEKEEEEEEEEEEDDDDQRRLVEEASNSRRRWRRSFSDKYPRDSIGGEHHHHHQHHHHHHQYNGHGNFPTRFLTWTNSHKQLATNCPDNRWPVGVPHIALTIRRPREDLVASGS